MHRFFAFILARVLVSQYVGRLAAEECKAGENLPPTRFHEYLVEEGLVASSAELQSMLELALVTGAKQAGFIAEIESKKWVYKGERFKIVATVEHEAYTEKYLRMIALFQVAICASEHKSRCIDIFINNFGTDDWLSAFLMSLGHPDGPAPDMFQGLPNFAVEKLASQIQLLLLKLIEIAITEASFLLPAKSKMFDKKRERLRVAVLEGMQAAHLRREVMHTLFS